MNQEYTAHLPFKPKPIQGRHEKSEISIKEKSCRIQRISRLMALSLHFEKLVKTKSAADFAEIARLGYVTRARLSQITNLLLLAPDIQEELLFLPPITCGRDQVTEHDIRRIVAVPCWKKQRKMWKSLKRKRFESN